MDDILLEKKMKELGWTLICWKWVLHYNASNSFIVLYMMQTYVFRSRFCYGALKHVVEVNTGRRKTSHIQQQTQSCWCENRICTVQQAKPHYRVPHRDMLFAKVIEIFFWMMIIKIYTFNTCSSYRRMPRRSIRFLYTLRHLHLLLLLLQHNSFSVAIFQKNIPIYTLFCQF